MDAPVLIELRFIYSVNNTALLLQLSGRIRPEDTPFPRRALGLNGDPLVFLILKEEVQRQIEMAFIVSGNGKFATGVGIALF